MSLPVRPRQALVKLFSLVLVAGAFIALNPATSAASTATSADKQDPQIVGGVISSTSNFPWQVRLSVQTAEGSALCGGAIIHSRIVLTAAHCLVGATDATAYFGKDQEATGGVPLGAYDGFIAPDYNASILDNDFGFLVFPTPIPAQFTPIKIAGPSEGSLWRAGRMATAVGFGHTTEGGTASPTLQQVDLPIQPDSVCSAPAAYGSMYRPPSMLCVGYLEGGRSTCQGDSGGPVVVPVDGGGYRIAGIVSWAVGCARPGKPSVFTRIAEPAMSARLVEQINAVKNHDNYRALFPGVESAIDILGAGALPPGCTAAQGAAGAAAAAFTGAQAAVAQAVAGLTGATKAQKKAKKKLKKAKKKLKKLNKRASKKIQKAKKKVKKAKKKLKRAKRATTASTQAVAAANGVVAATQANSAVASGNATAACS